MYTPYAWIVSSCSRGQVNAAEAEFWRRSQGTRVEYSDRILGFECGGQQWVNEVCFPVGTLKEPNGRDLDYMVSDGVRVYVHVKSTAVRMEEESLIYVKHMYNTCSDTL